MDTTITPALLRVPDLADLLNTTPAQVRNMRARGQLPPPFKRAGLRLCWRRADIEKWLAGR